LNRDFKYLLLTSSDAFFKFIDFLSAERAPPSLAMEVCSYRTDGTFRTVKIELDQDYLVEVNKDNNQVRRKVRLIDLETIRVIDKSRQVHLVLQFDRSF
jgi:hypothetical protein